MRRWDFSGVLSAHPSKCALFALWRLVFPKIKCFNSWSSSKHPFTVVITQFVMVNCTAVEHNDALDLSFQSKCLLSFKMYLTYLFKLITMMFTGLKTAKVFSSLSWTSDKIAAPSTEKVSVCHIKAWWCDAQMLFLLQVHFSGQWKDNIKPLASTFVSGCSFTNTFPKKWLLKQQLLTFFKNL